MKKVDTKSLQNLTLQNESPKESDEQNLLCVDYGEKFCGLAFSPDGICVLPVGVFEVRSIESEIRNQLNKKSIQKIIIGLPLSNDNTENEWCQEVRTFGEKLEKLCPIEFVNERFSSQNVLTPDKFERTDDLAAAQILEFYLSSKQVNKKTS